MTDKPEPAVGLPELIVRDTPCRRCGYNLRGLTNDRQCPECGTLIRLSLRQDLLEHSDPAWLDILRHGINWMLWYVGAAVLFVVAFVILRANRVPMPAPSVTIVGAIITGMDAWGRYLATKPDPSGLGEAEYRTARRLVRAAIFISLFGLVLAPVRASALLPPELLIVLAVLEAILEATRIVGLIAEMHYFEKLTLRIPDVGLSRRAQFLKLAMGISGGIVVAMVIILQLATRIGRRPVGLRAVAGCGILLAGAPLLVFILMYANFLGKLATRLKQLARVARESWAAAHVSTGTEATGELQDYPPK